MEDSDWVTLMGNTMEGNVGTRGWDYQGGGLSVSYCDYLTLNHNTFRANAVGGGWSRGGGLYLYGGRYITLTANFFEANTASSNMGWGGGAHLTPLGSLTLDGNVFLQNVGTTNPGTASWGGGLYLTGQPPITLTNNAFVGNEASSAGSGVYIAQVAVRLRYTTFMKNSGGDGSALCITGSAGSAQMVNSIFAGHSVGLTIMAGARAVLDYTLWSANDTNAGPGVVHTHDFAGNSAFAADGYHLTSSSAALGQALDIGVNQDIDGQRRPVGSGFDLGADEYMPTVFLPLVRRNTSP